MQKDYFEIKDKRDLNIIGRNLLLPIVIGYLLTFLIRGMGASIILGYIAGLLTQLSIYAIIVLRNLEVIESEQYRKVYRRGAYFVLFTYPFFMIVMTYIFW